MAGRNFIGSWVGPEHPLLPEHWLKTHLAVGNEMYRPLGELHDQDSR